jgi:hypothetical protein
VNTTLKRQLIAVGYAALLPVASALAAVAVAAVAESVTHGRRRR